MYIPNLASRTSCSKHENKINEYESLKNQLQEVLKKDVVNSELNNKVMNEILNEMNKLMKDIESFRAWYGYDLEFNRL